MSKISEFLIRHTTNIDPHSLDPFEETVIEGIIIIIILLTIISVIVGKTPKTTIEVKHYEGQGMTVETKKYLESIAYRPGKHEGTMNYPPKKE